MPPSAEYCISARAGVDNELADRHIPEIPKVNDTLAGPVGRRSDRVGGFYFIRRDDLKAVAPLWLKYTEDVRADPEVGDVKQAYACACVLHWFSGACLCGMPRCASAHVWVLVTT